MQLRAFGYGRSADTSKRGKTADVYPMRLVAKPQVGGRPLVRDGLMAGAVAGVLSGAPSTVHALLTGRDPLAAAVAAGDLLLRREGSPGRSRAARMLAGAVAHTGLSLGWGTVLAVAVRRTSLPPVPAGVAAGAVIAALDLGLLAHGRPGRRWPLIRALPVWPQVADHLAFGAVAGEVLRRRG